MSLPTFARIQTGEISGTVSAEGGDPLNGVRVMLISDSLQGVRTEVSGDKGFFRFPVLPAGTYSVVFSKKGYATLEVTGVRVVVAQNRIVDAGLPQSSAGDSLIARSTSPLVDTSTSDNIFEFTSKALELLPTSPGSVRDAVKFVPGVTGTRRDSAEGGASGLPGIRGHGPDGNQYLVDGLSVRGTAAFDDVIPQNYDSIQSLLVVSDPYTPEYGRQLGGTINVVTKSGGNDLSAELGFQLQDDSLEAHRKAVRPTESVTGLERTRFWGNIGAPLSEDKVWSFLSYNLNEAADVSAGAGSYVIGAENLAGQDGSAYGGDLELYRFQNGRDTRKTESIFGKLTISPAQSHNLFISYFDQSSERQRRIGLADLWSQALANANRSRVSYQWVSGSGVLEIDGGAQKRDRASAPLADSSVASRQIRDIGWTHANLARSDHLIETRTSYGAKWGGYIETDRFGGHELSLGFTIEDHESDWAIRTTGAAENFMPSPFGPGASFTFGLLKANDGRFVVDDDGKLILVPNRFTELRDRVILGKVEGHGIFLQDRVILGDWTIMGGIRLDRATVNDDLGQEVWSWDEGDFLSPRLSIVWDVGGRQNHIAKASWGVFKDGATSRMLEYLLPEGRSAFRRWRWTGDPGRAASDTEIRDPANWDFLAERSPESSPVGFDPRIELDSTERVSLEYSWRISREHALTLLYSQSETEDMLEDVATFEYSADRGEPGYDPGEEGAWTWRLVNFPLKERSFKSVDVLWKGEVGRMLEYSASYTWTENEGTSPGELEAAVSGPAAGGRNVGPYGDNAQARPEDQNLVPRRISELGRGLGSVTGDEGWYGTLSDATDHAVTLLARWRLPWDLEAVSAFQWVSGYHYSRRGFSDLYGGYLTFPEGRGSGETDDAHWLDLSLAYTWKVGSSHTLQGRLDALNLSNSQEIVQYVEEDTIDFGKPRARQDPRALMVGVRLRY